MGEVRDRVSAFRRLALYFTLTPMMMSLGACASFQAHPEPVLNTTALVASANFNIPGTLIAFGAPEGNDQPRAGLSRKEYRNMVVGTLMMAADSRYLQFRRRLASESRGSSLLLDIGILGLSGGASLASEATANALAAGAAGLTGTRAAVSRDVYFDRTIPAMIGIMDAERTRLRTAIMVNLLKPADDYPLAIALSDVAAYENAASLDGAIEILTREAAERAEDARNDYAEEVQSYTGPPEEGVASIRRRIRAHVLTLARANDVGALVTIARNLGLNPAAEATADDLRRLIAEKIDSDDRLEATQRFATQVGLPEEE